MLNDLAQKEKTKSPTSVAEVLHEIAEKNHKRSLIIIFSDMFDKAGELNEIFDSLQHLKHKKHEVLIFHVTDRNTEFNFEFDERPYEFIDLENGQKLKIQPSQIKDTFEKKMKEYYHELKIRCGQLKIDLVEADINNDYNNILNTYLVKRTKMK
jgi:hypothetical protein